MDIAADTLIADIAARHPRRQPGPLTVADRWEDAGVVRGFSTAAPNQVLLDFVRRELTRRPRLRVRPIPGAGVGPVIHEGPVPERVADAAGATLFTRENVEHGQEVRLSEIARDPLALERHGRSYAELDPDSAGGVDGAVHRMLKENRYDPGTGTLLFTPAEAKAWQTQKVEWADYFSGAETAA
jgi:hypothetical protein